MGFFSFGSNIFLVLAASDNYCKAPRNYCLHDIKKTFTHSYCHGYFFIILFDESCAFGCYLGPSRCYEC